jgi:hypothetical protein
MLHPSGLPRLFSEMPRNGDVTYSVPAIIATGIGMIFLGALSMNFGKTVKKDDAMGDELDEKRSQPQKSLPTPPSGFSLPKYVGGARNFREKSEGRPSKEDPLSYDAIDVAISNMSPKELLDFDATIGVLYGMTPEEAKNDREQVSAIFDELEQRGGMMRP